MIQFTIKKGNEKKGNYIRLHHRSLLFDNIPYLLSFIQTHSNKEMEKRLLDSLEVFTFQDGTIYVLNSIGRSVKLETDDICVESLALEPFGTYIKGVPEEERKFELVADLDTEELFLYRKELVQFSISFQKIRKETKEEIIYELYKGYLTVPLATK